MTLSVGATRVKCLNADDFCLLVDRAPYDDVITKFEYDAGYHHTLKVSKIGDGRHVLDETVAKTGQLNTVGYTRLRSAMTPSGGSLSGTGRWRFHNRRRT